MKSARALPLFLVLIFAAFALHADQAPTTAAALFEQAMDNLGKQEGFHMRLNAKSTVDEDGKMFVAITSEGWVRNPDMGIFKVDAPKGAQGTVFHKGAFLLNKDAVRDKWFEDGKDLPKKFQDLRLVNPIEYLNEFRKLADKASFLPDEKLDERMCRVVRLEIPTEAIQSFIGKMGIMEEAIDWPTAKCALRFWISAGDILLRQGVADCEVTVTKIEGVDDKPTHLTPVATFAIFDYNEKVGLDLISPGLNEKLEKEGIKLK